VLKLKQLEILASNGKGPKNLLISKLAVREAGCGPKRSLRKFGKPADFLWTRDGITNQRLPTDLISLPILEQYIHYEVEQRVT